MSRRLALPVLLLIACGDTATTARAPARDRKAIINGIVDPGHWYVGMVLDPNDGVCTGTLISARTVITAGHCWGFGSSRIDRVVFDVGRPQMRVTVPVAQSVRHPGYDDNSLTNDLALVQLAADAPVQPAPLLRETLGAPHIGPIFSWVGYGDTDLNGNGSGTRRVVTFPIQHVGPVSGIPVSPSAPPGASDSIDATQLYFRISGRNTCSGDSGGPGFVVRNGVERHAGVTSYGDEECAYDGVAARTDAARMQWIQQTLDSFEPGGPCRADGLCGAGCASTNPAPLGTLSDPDCAPQHCGADGICVLSCSPVDADCASLAIDACGADGVCKPGCSNPDVDCMGGGTAGGTGAAGGTGTAGGATAGGNATAGGSTAGGGDPGTAGGATATAGGSEATAGGSDVFPKMDEPQGCHCASIDLAWPLLALVLARRAHARHPHRARQGQRHRHDELLRLPRRRAP